MALFGSVNTIMLLRADVDVKVYFTAEEDMIQRRVFLLYLYPLCLEQVTYNQRILPHMSRDGGEDCKNFVKAAERTHTAVMLGQATRVQAATVWKSI